MQVNANKSLSFADILNLSWLPTNQSLRPTSTQEVQHFFDQINIFQVESHMQPILENHWVLKIECDDMYCFATLEAKAEEDGNVEKINITCSGSTIIQTIAKIILIYEASIQCKTNTVSVKKTRSGYTTTHEGTQFPKFPSSCQTALGIKMNCAGFENLILKRVSDHDQTLQLDLLNGTENIGTKFKGFEAS